jgi:hypothetical protein
MADERVKISGLPAASGIHDNDLFPVTQPDVVDGQTGQAGVTGKATAAALANYTAQSQAFSRRIQEGSALMYNRGVIKGCTASKGTTGRKVLLAAGAIFAKGMEMPCEGDQNGITVPANPGAASLVYYGYVSLDAGNALAFSITAAGAAVPAGGIPICQITVPVGNSAGNLDGVTIADKRRVEAGFPLLLNSIISASVALPYAVTNTAYTVQLDVTGYLGGGSPASIIRADGKAANGFKIYVDGILDGVNVRWTAVKMQA